MQSACPICRGVMLMRQDNFGHAECLEPARVVRLIEGERTGHRGHARAQGVRERADAALMRDRADAGHEQAVGRVGSGEDRVGQIAAGRFFSGPMSRMPRRPRVFKASAALSKKAPGFCTAAEPRVKRTGRLASIQEIFDFRSQSVASGGS